MRRAVVALFATTAATAAPVHGLVYDDRNGDGEPSPGEPGVAGAVVALGVHQFVVTDAHGNFELDVEPGSHPIAWVRVPDGFVPGPVWAPIDGDHPDRGVDLALTRLATPQRGPITFVVTADTHIAADQPFGDDLAQVIADATALDPAPAFVTILGDVTQGNLRPQFESVDRQLAQLGAPYIPVPGNHDWYDGGLAWFQHYGPDNYSFDIATTHFVVWNMAMTDAEVRDYLGAELARVARGTTIVALTHAPPSEAVVAALRALGVDYLLTGHTHTNRVVDHVGVIELNTEPLLMGGLDFTPAGYRVMTIDAGKLTSYHRTVVDRPVLRVVAPALGQCVPVIGGRIIAAVEADAGDPVVTARIDCATPIALRYAGGWAWQAALPPLAPGAHSVIVDGHAGRARDAVGFTVCTPPPLPPTGPDWAQLGGAADHAGARAHEVAPPLIQRWATPIGGHVLQAAPVIAGGQVFVTATDQASGDTGGVAALDLATGALRWRTATPRQIRSGPAVATGLADAGDTVVAAQVDGTVLGLDAQTGEVRWRAELGDDVAATAQVIDAAPALDAGDVVIGNQRRLAAIGAARGTIAWQLDPVPHGQDSEALAAVAIGDGVAVATFNRALGGLGAWDRMTGARRWRVESALTTAINASPVIGGGQVFAVNGLDEVFALDLATGALRWRTKLDPAGFDWGHATVGAPALAHGILVVPTLYRDLVALDATTGMELWRHAGAPSPLRTTHYRGSREAGYEASPVITGDLVWAADTAGTLVALDLRTGADLWHTALGAPVLGGLVASGDWLIAATYDGVVRGFTIGTAAPIAPASCDAPPPAGCCSTGGSPSWLVIAIVAWATRRRRA